jgi:hypothetical protein
MAKKRTKKLSSEIAPLIKKKRVGDPKEQILNAFGRYNAFHERNEKWKSQFKTRYTEKENPLALWDCYDYARKMGEAIPDFVLEYFDRVAGNLFKGDNNLKSVGHCLELNVKKKNKGGHSAFTQYRSYLERRKAVFSVYQKIEDKPEMSVEAACYQVAEEQSLPVDGATVFKWYCTKEL